MNEAWIRFFVPVDAKSILQLYKTIDTILTTGCNKINILLSSVGGDVDMGLSANMYIKQHIESGLQIDTYAMGNVDSIANLIFCLGKNRYSSEHSTFTIHDVNWNHIGSFSFSPDKLQEVALGMEHKRNIIAELLDVVMNKGVERVKEIMKKGIVLTAKEAKEYNLVTEIKNPAFTKNMAMYAIDQYNEDTPKIKFANLSSLYSVSPNFY